MAKALVHYEYLSNENPKSVQILDSDRIGQEKYDEMLAIFERKAADPTSLNVVKVELVRDSPGAVSKAKLEADKLKADNDK